MQGSRRSLFITLGLCLTLSAEAIAQDCQKSEQRAQVSMNFENYMATREPNDPDPTAHMRTLIEYTKANRRAAVENCAKQNPPRVAKDCPGGVPFCALITDRRTDQVIAKACNHGVANPVFHGEIAAINLFANVLQAQGTSFSEVAAHHDIYTTGESCAMCMGAIMWAGFNTVFFGSNVEFLNNYYSQIMIKNRELTGLWRACQGKKNTIRTRVVGEVLEKESNAVFEEIGFQFCPIVSAHSPGPKSSKK